MNILLAVKIFPMINAQNMGSFTSLVVRLFLLLLLDPKPFLFFVKYLLLSTNLFHLHREILRVWLSLVARVLGSWGKAKVLLAGSKWNKEKRRLAEDRNQMLTFGPTGSKAIFYSVCVCLCVRSWQYFFGSQRQIQAELVFVGRCSFAVGSAERCWFGRAICSPQANGCS